MTVLKQILCVDHNSSNVHLLESILGGLDVELTTVFTAIEALKLLENKNFTTVLVNLRPADMDGLEFISEIRKADGFTAESKLVGVTTSAVIAEHQAFLNAGVNEILTRPISSERLKAVVTGEESVETKTKASVTRLSFDFGESDENPELDADTIKQLISDIGAENTKQAMSLFGKELENNHAWIATSIGQGSDDIAMGAHSIKGCAKALGAARIAQSAEDLETACRLGASDHDLKQLVSELSRAVSRFQQSLEKTDLQEFAQTATA